MTTDVTAPRFLHVANGWSTTMTIQAAGVPGACTIWADPLHEGPVPGGLTDDELLDVRRRFLGPSPDPETDLRKWRATIANHDAYDELVLWFEHDLFDQLNLVQLLTWIRETLPPTRPVSLICIDSFPGRPNFKGLGELTAAELAPLFQLRRPVTDAQYSVARLAWEAFRAPTPEALEALRRSDTSALPYLAAAVTRFLQDYPSVSDGLSRSERRLLELASSEGITLRDAFARLGEGDREYHITDESLTTLVDDLCSASPPLLAFHSHAGQERSFAGRVQLTDTGRAVLDHRLDRVSECGIDRWLGGVHLAGRHVPWRWDHSRQRTVPA